MGAGPEEAVERIGTVTSQEAADMAMDDLLQAREFYQQVADNSPSEAGRAVGEARVALLDAIIALKGGL